MHIAKVREPDNVGEEDGDILVHCLGRTLFVAFSSMTIFDGQDDVEQLVRARLLLFEFPVQVDDILKSGHAGC